MLLLLFSQAASAQVTQRPSGVMWDVEPHATALWKTDWHAAANHWLDFLGEVTHGLAEARPALKSSACLPFWYDGKMVTRNGKTKPLLHWAMDLLDEVLLMAYRDSAEGSDGIIELSRPNLDYAASIGKGCVIAVELSCSVSTDKVTFCQEGVGRMEGELGKVQAALGSHRGFRGLAVHDYKWWSGMAPGSTGAANIPVSTFMWQTGDAVYPGVAQSKMLQFFHGHGVKEVYVGLIHVMRNSPATITRFLNISQACNFQTQLLYGKHAWIMPEERQEARDLVYSTVKFQNTAVVVPPDPSAACPTTYHPPPTDVSATRRRRRRRRRRCSTEDAGVKADCPAQLEMVSNLAQRDGDVWEELRGSA